MEKLLTAPHFATPLLQVRSESPDCRWGRGGQSDRLRLFLRGVNVSSLIGRQLVSLDLPRHCLRRVVARCSPPPTSHVHCQCSSLTSSRPRAGRFACCLLVWRAPQVSFNILFKSSRCASTSDIINEIEGVEIDSVSIAASRRGGSLIRPSAVHPRSPARVPCIPRTLHIPRAGCAVCKPGFSRCGGGIQDFYLCRSCARRRDRRCRQGQWAGVRARQQGAAGAASGQGSRQWARGTGGRHGACVGRRRRASRSFVRRSVECLCLCGGRGAAWRWRDSAGASPEPPLPRASGRTCACSAAATAVPRVARCAPRYARSWLVCLMRKLRSTAVRVRCDMLEYARAQMSCLRVFYLSRVVDGCLYNTQIPRHAQPTRSCKIHCTPLAIAPHLDWRTTHHLNPPCGSNAGRASSFGSTIEPDELPRQKTRPTSRLELCVGRATAARERDSMRKREGVLGRRNSQCDLNGLYPGYRPWAGLGPWRPLWPWVESVAS